MNSFWTMKKPTYNSFEKCWCIKDVYSYTEPYNGLFSLTFNSLFKNKEDACRELIMYLYFEHDYSPNFLINDIYSHTITDNDIFHLDNYLEKHLKDYQFSWKISELEILYNEEEN